MLEIKIITNLRLQSKVSELMLLINEWLTHDKTALRKCLIVYLIFTFNVLAMRDQRILTNRAPAFPPSTELESLSLSTKVTLTMTRCRRECTYRPSPSSHYCSFPSSNPLV